MYHNITSVFLLDSDQPGPYKPSRNAEYTNTTGYWVGEYYARSFEEGRRLMGDSAAIVQVRLKCQVRRAYTPSIIVFKHQCVTCYSVPPFIVDAIMSTATPDPSYIATEGIEEVHAEAIPQAEVRLVEWNDEKLTRYKHGLKDAQQKVSNGEQTERSEKVRATAILRVAVGFSV